MREHRQLHVVVDRTDKKGAERCRELDEGKSRGKKRKQGSEKAG